MTSGMAGRWSVQGLGSWWPVAWQASGKRLASAWQAGGKRPVFLASACFTILGKQERTRFQRFWFWESRPSAPCIILKERHVGSDRVWVSAWIALAAKRRDSRILPGPWGHVKRTSLSPLKILVFENLRRRFQ